MEEMNSELKSKGIEINAMLSADTKDLLKCLLRKVTNDRYDINQVLQHPALTKNIEEFKRPLSESERKTLLENYMFNCGSSEVREMPEGMDQLSTEVKNEMKKSVAISEKPSLKKATDSPFNSEFKNFFDDVLHFENDPKVNFKGGDNFFDFVKSSNFFKKSAQKEQLGTDDNSNFALQDKLPAHQPVLGKEKQAALEIVRQ